MRNISRALQLLITAEDWQVILPFNKIATQSEFSHHAGV
jgi:hypothetical protein